MVSTVSTDAVTSVEHQTDTENILQRGGTHVKVQRVYVHHWQTSRSFQSKDIVQLFVCVVT